VSTVADVVNLQRRLTVGFNYDSMIGHRPALA
jgi:hypothetical protein